MVACGIPVSEAGMLMLIFNFWCKTLLSANTQPEFLKGWVQSSQFRAREKVGGTVLDPVCRNPNDPNHVSNDFIRLHYRQAILINFRYVFKEEGEDKENDMEF